MRGEEKMVGILPYTNSAAEIHDDVLLDNGCDLKLGRPALHASNNNGMAVLVAELNDERLTTLSTAVNLVVIYSIKVVITYFMLMLLCLLGRYDLTIAIFNDLKASTSLMLAALHGKVDCELIQAGANAVTEGTSPMPQTGKRAPIRQAGRCRRDLAVASRIIMASLVAACRTLALVLVVVAVSVTGAAGSNKSSLNITNHCTYTVWPGILSGAVTSSAAALDTTGFQLAPGESRAIPVPSGWSGLLWARTLCSNDATTGKFTCITGDCGSGKQDCAGGGPAPPATLAEFTLDGTGGTDLYDVSLVDGFNVPVLVAPQGAAPGGNGSCAPIGCAVDLNGACPAELRVKSEAAAAGDVVACKSACQAFGSSQYCCTGEYGNPDTCKPSPYSEFFKNACPRAVSYAYDDGASTCDAGDTIYAIIFCPSATRTSVKSSASSPNLQPSGNDGTMPYAGGSQVGAPTAASPPWRIVLLVAVMSLLAAAFGVLAQVLGLFSHCFKLNQQEGAGADGEH